MNHVAMVLPGFPGLGGAERQTLSLALGLKARGWRVTVVAMSLAGGEAERQLRSGGVEFLALGMRKGLADPRGWLGFHRWLQSEQPEILHAHLPHAAWFCRGSRLMAPARVVVDTIHSAGTGSIGRRLGYRLTSSLPDWTTAVSQQASKVWLARGMVRGDRLSVVPNGVDPARFGPDAEARRALRRRLGLADEFLWLAAGRLEPVKDYPTLLWTLAQLPSQAHLAIAGQGPMEAALRGLSTELGLAGRVHFLGFQPSMEQVYPAADGFVLSSLWEGLPVALLEAGLCGLPSVATPVAGVDEIVEPGRTGLVAGATRSALALEGSMNALMRMSPEARAAMGQAARERVQSRFGLDAVLDRWEALYRNLLDQNPQPRRRGFQDR